MAFLGGLIASGLGFAAGTFAYGATQVVVGLAVTKVASEIAQNSVRQKPRALESLSTTRGETTGHALCLGAGGTGGHRVAPFYSHDSGDDKYLFRTGIYTFCNVAGATLNPVIMINGDRVELTGPVHPQYGMSPPSESPYSGYLWMRWYDGTQTTADSDLVSRYGSHSERPWTSEHILRETGYAIVTYRGGKDSPWDSVTEPVFEYRGIPLYDISQDTTAGGLGPQRWSDRSTWRYSSNAAVIAYCVLRGIEVQNGQVFGGSCEEEDLPAEEWIKAIAECSMEDVSTNTGGLPIPFWNSLFSNKADTLIQALIGEEKLPRYPVGMRVSLASAENSGDTAMEVAQDLFLASGGEISDNGGVFYPRIGPPDLPSVVLGEESFLDDKSQSVSVFSTINDSYNAVSATYASAESLFQPVEASRYEDAEQIAKDGEYLVTSFQMRAATNERQVQRIIKAIGKDARRQIQHAVPLGKRGCLMRPLQTVDVTSPEHQYTNKDFEVTKIQIDPETLETSAVLREVDPLDDVFEPADEVLVPSASYNIVPTEFASLQGFGAEKIVFLDEDGDGRAVGIRITWGGEFVQGDRIAYEVRVNVTDQFIVAATVSDPSLLRHEIATGIKSNVQYKVRAKIVTDIPSDWEPWIVVRTDDIRAGSKDISQVILQSIDNAQQEAEDVAADLLGVEQRTLTLENTAAIPGSNGTILVGGTALLFQAPNIIARGSVGLDQLAVGLGRNLIKNSEFEQGLLGWGSAGSEGAMAAETTFALRGPGDTYSGVTYPTLAIRQGGSASDGQYDVYNRRVLKDGSVTNSAVPVNPGSWYMVSAKVDTIRCSARMYMFWRQADGTFIGSTGVDITVGTVDPQNPDSWPVSFALGQAPSNAAFCNFVMRKYGSTSGTTSWVFIHHPQIEESHEDAKFPSPFSPSGTTLIDGSGIITKSITAANAVFADAAIVNANIANLAVDTLKIADNAVTAPYEFVQSGTASTASTTWVTIMEGAIPDDLLPYDTLAVFAGRFRSTGNLEYEVRMREVYTRNGADISFGISSHDDVSIRSDSDQWPTMIGVRRRVTGSDTNGRIRVQFRRLSGTGTLTASGCDIKADTFKK